MTMIDLRTPLSLRSSFLFPLQSREARREVLVGALLLLVPFVGWLLNMGHRIRLVHAMQRGEPAWPAWRDFRGLLWHGLLTWLGMACYLAPGSVLVLLGRHLASGWIVAIGLVFCGIAIVAIPGYMSHFCVAFDAREIFDPFRALRRVFEAGPAYWHAWGIALVALALSFLGLLLLGIGFLATSVWFWQVAGFSFATAFTRAHRLGPSTA